MAAINQTFFISHGSPTLSIDDSLEARHFLKAFKEKVFSLRPKGILMVSAHWDTTEPALTTNPGNYDTIHDFYGFPKPMYQIRYPAPGTPELAKKVKELLTAAGFNEVHEDKKRGLDHGAWVPLMLMYPEANIPVCQLSVQSSRSGTYHYEMGRALAPLRNEGYLIIGSGSATHNLRSLHPTNSVDSWALQFDTWLKDALLSGRYDDINHYEEKAPNARTAHPWPEHFYPLHVALGSPGHGSVWNQNRPGIEPVKTGTEPVKRFYGLEPEPEPAISGRFWFIIFGTGTETEPEPAVWNRPSQHYICKILSIVRFEPMPSFNFNHSFNHLD